MPRQASTVVKIRKKGDTFQARPYIDGKQISISGTRDHVEKELAKLALGKRRTDSGSFTLEHFLTDWLKKEQRRVDIGKLANNTYLARKGPLEQYVIPDLGHIHLRSLTRGKIRDYFEAQEALANGSGTRRLQQAFEALRTALNDAVEDSLIEENPAATPAGSKRSIKPRHVKKDRTILTVEQAKVLLNKAEHDEEIPAYTYPLLLTALTTGMRQGELFGLRTDRLDLKHGKLKIMEQYDAVAGKMKETKTKRYTTVSLPSKTVDVLRSWVGDRKGLVFPNTDGGPLNPSNFMFRVFRPLLKEAKLPRVDFHSLRHTSASILISAGVNIKTVSKRLGHTKVQITLDTYGHLMPDDDTKAAEVFDSIL